MIDETLLDDPAELARLDTDDVLRALATAGAQVRRARTAAAEAGIERTADGERPRAVVVAALGTSSVAASLLTALAGPTAPVPVSVRSAAPLPAWVGPLDLVVVLSLSGRAPGPVELAAAAARRGASLLTVGAPDSPLAHACALARGVHVPVPADVASSRTGLWSLLTPVLVAADHLGLVDAPAPVLDAVADRLDARAYDARPSSESFVNPAKSLALRVGDTVPAALGDSSLTGVAAARFAAMLARCARVPTTHGELPDAAAQIVATFGGPFAGGAALGDAPAGGDIFADPFLDAPALPPLGLALFRCAEPTPQQRRAADAVALGARDAGVKVEEIVGEGASALERLADQVALGDFAAAYTALGHRLDPGRSAHVDALHRP